MRKIKTVLKKVASKTIETFYTRSLSLEYLDQHFRQEWKHLATQCLEPNIFYTPSFLMALRHHLMAHQNIIVLTTWRQAERRVPELTGVMPMIQCRFLWGRPVNILQSLHHPYIPSTTPLIHKTYAEQSIINLIDYLEEPKHGYKAVNMPFLPSDGKFYALLEHEIAFRERKITLLDSYPRAALSSDLTPEAYALTMRKSRRKDIQKRGNKLAQLGTINHLCYKEPEELDNALNLFLDLESSGWKGKKGTAMKSSAKTASFAHDALCLYEEGLRCQYDFLAVDGTIIAGTITLIHQDKAWAYKSAYDENYAQYAPSLQAYMQITKDLLENDTITVADSAAFPGHVIEGLWQQRTIISNILFPCQEQTSPQQIKNLARAYALYTQARNTIKQWVLKIKK